MQHNTLVVPWGRHGDRDASDRRSGRRWVLGPHRAGRGLATPARLGSRIGLSTIPLDLLGGLGFGNGGLLPPRFSEHSVQAVAEIGVVLLLSMRGLEDTGEELGANLRAGLPSGAVDFLLNFPPGAAHWARVRVGTARRAAAGRRDLLEVRGVMSARSPVPEATCSETRARRRDGRGGARHPGPPASGLGLGAGRLGDRGPSGHGCSHFQEEEPRRARRGMES